MTRDKNAFFEQLQLRQAELESAQAHLESIQHQNTEFQFQLREANDRVALLKEECSELLREHETRSRDPGPSAEEIARMVSATEAKYESKLSELKRNLGIMEKERHESESDWSRKLKEKVKELEDLKRILGSAAKTREADENVVANLKAELAHAQQTAKSLERQLSDLPPLRDQVNELEVYSVFRFCSVSSKFYDVENVEGTRKGIQCENPCFRKAAGRPENPRGANEAE